MLSAESVFLLRLCLLNNFLNIPACQQLLRFHYAYISEFVAFELEVHS